MLFCLRAGWRGLNYVGWVWAVGQSKHPESPRYQVTISGWRQGDEQSEGVGCDQEVNGVTYAPGPSADATPSPKRESSRCLLNQTGRNPIRSLLFSFALLFKSKPRPILLRVTPPSATASIYPSDSSELLTLSQRPAGSSSVLRLGF